MSLRSLFTLPQRATREGSLGIFTAGRSVAAVIAKADDGGLRLKATESFDGASALGTLARWQRSAGWHRCR